MHNEQEAVVATPQPQMLFQGVPIRDVQRLSLQPGDIVVLKVGTMLSNDARRHVRQTLEHEFPGHKVLVLDPGMDLGVLAAEEPEA